jgi:hypothetical protein
VFTGTAELRLRAILKHRTIHFARVVDLPFQPAAGLTWHDGPPPPEGTSYRLTSVLWLSAQGRFVCHVEDDRHAGQDFGDDLEAARGYYEARGWHEVQALPFRVLALDRLAPTPA